VKDARARDSGNTLLHKQFPGGHITMAGANSAASLASRPVRVVLCDEVDRYPVSAGTEGDPIKLAQKRSATFWNRRFLAGSTPTVKGASRVEIGFASSDQRRYFVPCRTAASIAGAQVGTGQVGRREAGDGVLRVRALRRAAGDGDRSR
jgi:phage terminase large subunit GpA-like protein